MPLHAAQRGKHGAAGRCATRRRRQSPLRWRHGATVELSRHSSPNPCGDSFLRPASASVSTSGTDSYSLKELGTYAPATGFALASLVYQAGGSQSSSEQDASADSYTGSGNDSFADTSNQDTAGPLPGGPATAVGSFTNSGSDNYTQSGSDSFSLSLSAASTSSLSEAGSASDAGGCTLSNVSYGESGSDSWSVRQAASSTSSGTAGTTNTGTGTGAISGATAERNGSRNHSLSRAASPWSHRRAASAPIPRQLRQPPAGRLVHGLLTLYPIIHGSGSPWKGPLLTAGGSVREARTSGGRALFPSGGGKAE